MKTGAVIMVLALASSVVLAGVDVVMLGWSPPMSAYPLSETAEDGTRTYQLADPFAGIDGAVQLAVTTDDRVRALQVRASGLACNQLAAWIDSNLGTPTTTAGNLYWTGLSNKAVFSESGTGCKLVIASIPMMEDHFEMVEGIR